MRRAREKDDEAELPRSSQSSWSSRLAWLTLVTGGVVLLARVSVATVVQVHGQGMAPTLLDGDYVVLVRQSWGLDRGDIVVYDPTPPRAAPPEPAPPRDDAPRGQADGKHHPAPAPEGRALRNTAVVDREELDANWHKVQQRSAGLLVRERTSLRLGRVLALPGDEVTFFADHRGLGLTVNGEAIEQKPGEPLRLPAADVPATPGERIYEPRPIAYELVGDRRYPVLAAADPVIRWPGLALPAASQGPVQVTAEGYLVVADNREEGACCDSRALGWVAPESLEGRVLVRLAGDPEASPDLDPAARGFLWRP